MFSWWLHFRIQQKGTLSSSLQRICQQLRICYLSLSVIISISFSFKNQTLQSTFPSQAFTSSVSASQLDSLPQFKSMVHSNIKNKQAKLVLDAKASSILSLCSFVYTWNWKSLSQVMDCSPPSFSVNGILQGRILEWVAIPFSRDWTQVCHTAGKFLIIWATGSQCGFSVGREECADADYYHYACLSKLHKYNRK